MYTPAILLCDICRLHQHISGSPSSFPRFSLWRIWILFCPLHPRLQILFLKFFLTKAKLLGYILCNCSNASKLLFLGLAAFLFRLCPCLSVGLGAGLCCRRLHRAGGFKPWGFFYEPSAEKGAFQYLTVRYSLVGSLQSTGCRLFPWSWHLFSYRACMLLAMGEERSDPSRQLPLQPLEVTLVLHA